MELELRRVKSGGWGSSFYYDPEGYGLKMVASMDWDNEPYQFNLTVVVMDAEGRFWYGSDSGCSCPTPFENTYKLYRLWSMAQLEELAAERGKSLDRDFERAVRYALAGCSYCGASRQGGNSCAKCGAPY